jgi:hypothetical protein
MSDLRELLARKVHENWARLRTAEGWRYGPKRHDGRKKHPGVPFDELPGSEKDYGRETAMESMRTLLELGYTHQAPVTAGPTSAQQYSNASKARPENSLRLVGGTGQQDRATLQ